VGGSFSISKPTKKVTPFLQLTAKIEYFKIKYSKSTLFRMN
jgi:hypothetical protein